MILFEFEGKELISKYGIKVPKSQLLTKSSEKINIKTPLVLKAQVLSGRRKDVGGIVTVKSAKEVEQSLKLILGAKMNNEVVEKVLAEEFVDHNSEYYFSISYDTRTRGPALTFSESGGTGIEQRKVQTFEINPINFSFKSTGLPKELLPTVLRLIETFFFSDLLLLEINPLVITKNGEIYALDAKVKLDDEAKDRHPDWGFPTRGVVGHKPTKNEIAAKKIDQGDYRGTAGSAYFDLPGDIGVLASGGGASLAGMDALINAGGKPANYTEYSSDPTREKVKKLARIVLSKPYLNGLWIGGAVANFTDIYETLSGVLDALKEFKPKYPIVVRRGGPRDVEAFEMLSKEKDFDFHLYGSEISITESAKIMVKLAKDYATTS